MKKIIAFLLSLLGGTSSLAAQSAPGEAIYRERCASCNELVDPRIPPREALQRMPASRILRTLDFGVMMSVAYPLRRDEREAVAGYLGAPDRNTASAGPTFCADRSVKLDTPAGSQWNGWSP